VLVEHDSAVVCAGVSGDTIVSGSQTGGLIVWDIICGEPIHKLTGHKDSISVLNITLDGLFVLTGMYKNIKIGNFRYHFKQLFKS